MSNRSRRRVTRIWPGVRAALLSELRARRLAEPCLGRGRRGAGGGRWGADGHERRRTAASPRPSERSTGRALRRGARRTPGTRAPLGSSSPVAEGRRRKACRPVWGAWPAWSSAGAPTRCRCLCAQPPPVAVSATTTRRTCRFGVQPHPHLVSREPRFRHTQDSRQVARHQFMSN